MIKADKYLKETIREILEEGQWDKKPRTRWSDGTPAHSKFVTQKVFEYNIAKGEFPVNTLRTTALKGAWYDIEAIYIKQTNIIEEMHPSIHNWWKDFIVAFDPINNEWDEITYRVSGKKPSENIGETYGATVKRYDLMNKLLKGLEENSFGRRHKINLWQEQQVIDEPASLEPCAGLTLWSVRDIVETLQFDNLFFGGGTETIENKIRYIDLTLTQRSQDYITTASINSAQYVMLAMMVANHLTFKTEIKHSVGKLLHVVQNCHIYDKHLDSAQEILEREETGLQPKIELICEPKDFYSHTIEDFKFTNLEGIKPLTEKLEIAI